jgi:hypothetical protein
MTMSDATEVEAMQTRLRALEGRAANRRAVPTAEAAAELVGLEQEITGLRRLLEG